MENENLQDHQLPMNGSESIQLNPVAESESSLAHGLVKGVFLLAGAYFGAYFVFGGCEQAARGATRSSKLQWELRQAEMNLAQQAAKTRATAPSAPENNSLSRD